MKLSLVFLGTEAGGPVYCYEMAKALANLDRCELQVIISRRVKNLDVWKETFTNRKVDFHVVKSYNHNLLSVAVSYLNFPRMQKVVNLVKGFNADYVYFPHGLLWRYYIYPKLHSFSKIIITLHDPHPHNKLSLSQKIENFISRKSIYSVDYIAILNHKDKDSVINDYHKKTFVMPHASHSYYTKGINVSRQFDDYKIKNTIGFIGAISPYKRLDILVDAFENLSTRNIKLVIAGKGNIDMDLLKRIVANDNIELINRYIEDYEFPDLINMWDFIVLPYNSATQSGIIPLAFAFGKTVVATNVGALSEQIPEKTGILTDVTSSAVANAIDYLYKNPILIKEYGENALIYSETELSWTKSAEILLDNI